MKEKSEFSEALNKAEERTEARVAFLKRCFILLMTAEKKQEYRSFFSLLMAGEACEMRGSEMKTNEMTNSNRNKHREKETETKGV